MPLADDHKVARLVMVIASFTLAALIIGCGALYAYLEVRNDTNIPPTLTLVLGAAIVQIGGIVREFQARQLGQINDKIEGNRELADSRTHKLEAKLENGVRAGMLQNRENIVALNEKLDIIVNKLEHMEETSDANHG